MESNSRNPLSSLLVLASAFGLILAIWIHFSNRPSTAKIADPTEVLPPILVTKVLPATISLASENQSPTTNPSSETDQTSEAKSKETDSYGPTGLTQKLVPFFKNPNCSGENPWRVFDVDLDGALETIYLDGQSLRIEKETGRGETVSKKLQSFDPNGALREFQVSTTLTPIGISRNIRNTLHPALRIAPEGYYIVCVPDRTEQPTGQVKVIALYEVRNGIAHQSFHTVMASVSYYFPDNYAEEEGLSDEDSLAILPDEDELLPMFESIDLLHAGDEENSTAFHYTFFDVLRDDTPRVFMKMYAYPPHKAVYASDTPQIRIGSRPIDLEYPEYGYGEEFAFIPRDV